MLKIGSSGNAVRDLQRDLGGLGFSVGSTGVDGIFGSLTDSAVRKFQKANGLSVDGVVGPQTLKKIAELKAKADDTVRPKPPAPTRPVPVPVSKTFEPNLTTFLQEAGANPNNLVTIVNTAFNPPRAINFYGLAPDDLTESHTANFEPVEIMGRSSPLASYSGGGSRTVDISLDIHEDYLKAYSTQGNVANIVEFIGQVKALTYPRYQDNIVIPPRVFIKVGDFFRMKAYCNSVSVSWKKPIRDGRYIMAGINMNFTEILSISFSADEVATGKDLDRYFRWPG